MKSITTTKQELKELLEKGFFERAEPVKKGEELIIENGSWVRSPYILNLKGKMVCQVGDVCPVKNKKGEKLWIGKKWKKIFVQTDKEVEYLKKECLIDPYSNAEPLLVRLEKIEEQKTMYINNWLETFKRVEE